MNSILSKSLFAARNNLVGAVRLTPQLVTLPQRGYMPIYQRKYDEYLRPSFFDNPKRRPDMQGRIKYNTQDPLFFDYKHEQINGGIRFVSLPS